MLMAAWQRRRYTVLVSPDFGKAAIMDTFKTRLWKMRMRVTAWARFVKLYRDHYPSRMVMVLLTYKKVDDYRAGHINAFMKNLKQRLQSKLKAFAWVAEMQKRGAVHYHLILVVDKGTRIPLPDESGMWPHGWSGIHTARTPYYLLKYLGKEYQKDVSRFPKGCRLYTVSLRFGDRQTKMDFRSDAGIALEDLKRKAKAENQGDDEPWLYVGSSVTKSFAEEVLVPPGIEVVKSD